MTTPAQRYLADRYRLEEVLGRGATGTVWAAYDEVLRRRVAVKEVPPPPGMADADAEALRERTLREARAIAVLSHPNVVTLYDVVRQDGEPFVVMELLPAQSLAKVISEHGPLDVTGAALVGHAVASALQAAHEAGITHRDVKPGNVLIGAGPDDGRIKLADFGIARNVAESTMTVAGMTLGSPAFIAPEVAAGGVVGPAADLWGLGATLFAAVEGRPPYDAGEPLATVAAVVHGEVPEPTAAGPLTPVITGLMVKDPTQRLPLAEVCRMLRPLLPADGRVLHDEDATTALPMPPDPTWPDPSWVTPAGAPGSGPGSAPTDATVHTGGLPLATDPGPLPFVPAPAGTVRHRRRRPWLATVALSVASVVLFAGGAAGGFGLSRWAAGAPLVPEVSGLPWLPGLPDSADGGTPATPDHPATENRDELRTREVSVTNDRPGTTETMAVTFTIGVPEGWNVYRPPLSSDDTPIVAMFVAPEGNRAISVDQVRGYYPRGTVQNYLARHQAALAESVDEVVAQPVNPAGPPRPGATEGPVETGFNTVERGQDGAGGELRRTTLLYLLPTATDLWVIRLTVPIDQQKAADALYREVVGSFAPP